MRSLPFLIVCLVAFLDNYFSIVKAVAAVEEEEFGNSAVQSQLPFLMNSEEYGKIVTGPLFPRLFPDQELPCRLFIFHPKETGTYPITLFLSGMFGSLPTGWYTDLLAEMSVRSPSIVVALDLFGYLPSDYEDASRMMSRVLDWVLHADSRLNNRLPPSIYANSSQLVLVSHSSAAQSVMTLWKMRSHQISALFFLDPVDAMTIPALSSKISLNLPNMLDKAAGLPPTIDPSATRQLENLTQPLLLVSTGLCHMAALKLPPPKFINISRLNLPPIFTADNLWPACCPAGLGPERFWRVFSEPTTLGMRQTWHWNFTQYGHCDVLNNNMVTVNYFMKLCKSIVAKPTLPAFKMDVFRGAIVTLYTSFLSLVLKGNISSKNQLERNYWSNEKVIIQF